MATYHASAGELVDLNEWTKDLPNDQTKVIVKTEKFELIRLVIPAGKEIPDHKVSGPIIVHCIQGEIIFSTERGPIILTQGQLLHLGPGELHSVKADIDAVILLTIIF